MCKGKNKNSKLEEMYKILQNGSNVDKMAEKLVALQLHYRGKEWAEDKMSRIVCNKGSVRGNYSVEVQKKNPIIIRILHRYETHHYYFNTYGANYDGPDNIEFETEYRPQEFKPDSDSSYYEKILRKVN